MIDRQLYIPFGRPLVEKGKVLKDDSDSRRGLRLQRFAITFSIASSGSDNNLSRLRNREIACVNQTAENPQ